MYQKLDITSSWGRGPVDIHGKEVLGTVLLAAGCIKGTALMNGAVTGIVFTSPAINFSIPYFSTPFATGSLTVGPGCMARGITELIATRGLQRHRPVSIQ